MESGNPTLQTYTVPVRYHPSCLCSLAKYLLVGVVPSCRRACYGVWRVDGLRTVCSLFETELDRNVFEQAQQGADGTLHHQTHAAVGNSGSGAASRITRKLLSGTTLYQTVRSFGGVGSCGRMCSIEANRTKDVAKADH